METGLSSIPDDPSSSSYGSYLNPFGKSNLDDPNGLSRDQSCQFGAEIFLRRILIKLFKQVDDLQPNELDDEFVYQSIITYKDYLGMAKNMKDEQMSCANLINMENILSNILSSADVRRPMHTSLIGNIFSAPIISISFTSLHIHLSMVLMIVGFVAWFLSSKLGIRLWRSMLMSFFLVGFVEFCMHKNKLSKRHCKYPSYIDRLTSFLGYEYDNCNSDTSSPNIAFTGVEYLSELLFQPLVHLGEKLGRALQIYLNSFTGFNYFLAPFFPVIAITILCIAIPFAFVLRSRQSGACDRQSPARSIKSPRKNGRNNAITCDQRRNK